MKFLGHLARPKAASRRAYANCLRPTCPDVVGEAEFSRASGRGLRRVRNFIQDAKGMCKKESTSAINATDGYLTNQ